MNIDFKDLLTFIIAPAATAVVSWLLAMKKYKANVNTIELENVEKSLSIYRDMMKDLRDRQDALTKRIEELEDEKMRISLENKELKKKLRKMERYVNELKKENGKDKRKK